VNPGRKHHHPPHGGGARVAANSTKQKIWYQQTWHTIEFSNNRPATGTHAPETVSKLFIARTSRSLATALNSSPSVADPVPSHKRLPTAQRCSATRFEGVRFAGFGAAVRGDLSRPLRRLGIHYTDSRGSSKPRFRGRGRPVERPAGAPTGRSGRLWCAVPHGGPVLAAPRARGARTLSREPWARRRQCVG